MLSEKMQAALNDQLNMELGAYYTYLSMSAHFEFDGLDGFAAWMANHAQEEMVHAMKFYDFINRRRGRVTLKTIPGPRAEWASILEVFEDAFEHERRVTLSIDKLMALAQEENDNATASFLQWFVDEQVEEEELVDTAINKLKLIGDSGSALFLLDNEMGTNAAVPEAE